LRLTDLYRLPIYGDEADHIRWAQQFSVGDYTFPLFMDGKFLLGVLVAQFHPLGPSPLWLARAVVGIFSMLNVAACIAIGKQLRSSQVGLLAGLFYTILPQAVYYERQMLAEPLMAAFGSLALVSACRLAKKGQESFMAVSANARAAAFILKVFGAL
jgi:predicted membrane-bound mannosyltransferase